MLKSLIKNDWSKILNDEFSKDYFINLESFLNISYSNNTIFPEKNLIFEAFNQTPYKDVKVVILGQDPYHGENQSHGLCFSVQENIKLPPSLVNIYKELKNDLNISRSSGNLLDWSKQGVLLINNVFTVEKSKAGSHRKKGWEEFTESVFIQLNKHNKPIVFILWGNDAKKKEKLITNNKHLILTGPHPSPLSSYRGFFGSKPFSKTNTFLKDNNLEIIKW